MLAVNSMDIDFFQGFSHPATLQLCICICVICAQAAGWKPGRNWHNSQAAVSTVASFASVYPLLIVTLKRVEDSQGVGLLLNAWYDWLGWMGWWIRGFD